MVKNIYEILDEFEKASSKQERIDVLAKYMNHPIFLKVLNYTYNPEYQFYYNSFPKGYKEPNVNAISEYRFVGLENEIRRMYLFVKSDPRAGNITEAKRNILLLEILESFEPREAQVFINIMKKDLSVKYLTKSLILEVFPNLFSITM